MVTKAKPQGFSLVELSIVLVILGLLTGGILAGQSLIRAAELRSISTDYSRYITAAQSFRDKYFVLPGDFNKATSFWGAADGSTGLTTACKTAASTTAATCNGDANGRIEILTYSNEPYRFWQHLANAGLIEGTYSGVTDGSNDASTSANNAPKGRISTSLWHITYQTPVTGGTTYFDGIYDNYLQFGLPASSYGIPWGSIATPEETWNVDTKMDDGKPGQGKLLARDPAGMTGTNCTTATAGSQTSADYYLTGRTKVCSFMFRQVF